MNTYVRIVPEVTAVQVKWENWNDLCQFLPVPQRGHGMEGYGPELRLFVWTGREGESQWSTVAREGDWLVNEGGNLFVMDADTFQRTFTLKASPGELQATCKHQLGAWHHDLRDPSAMVWVCFGCKQPFRHNPNLNNPMAEEIDAALKGEVHE